MRNQKTKETKKGHKCKVIMLALGAVFTVWLSCFAIFGGNGTGESANAEEFAAYAKQVSEIAVPEEAEIIALGEATHGNAEFQRLKLDVLKVLVEKENVRAFAIEGDYGCCKQVNEYIHGGQGTAQEAAATIGFAIYRTQETADLLEYMRTYNETAAEGEDLIFYGFDMQRYEYTLQFLGDECAKFDIDTSALEEIESIDGVSDSHLAEKEAAVTAIRDQLLKLDQNETVDAIQLCDVLLQNISLGKAYESTGIDALCMRDRYMANNMEWILNKEKMRGNNRIMISGHNGHLQKKGCYREGDLYMGAILAEEYGASYYCIGTDFYKTCCNLPKGSKGKRANHNFYSRDPLAKAAKEAGLEECYLDFAQIPEKSELYTQVNSYMNNGTLGEGYSAIMRLLPRSYRVWVCPAEIYDSMIFVTNATPTEIIPAE